MDNDDNGTTQEELTQSVWISSVHKLMDVTLNDLEASKATGETAGSILGDSLLDGIGKVLIAVSVERGAGAPVCLILAGMVILGNHGRSGRLQAEDDTATEFVISHDEVWSVREGEGGLKRRRDG